jgi:hypothetical protein
MPVSSRNVSPLRLAANFIAWYWLPAWSRKHLSPEAGGPTHQQVGYWGWLTCEKPWHRPVVIAESFHAAVAGGMFMLQLNACMTSTVLLLNCWPGIPTGAQAWPGVWL